MRRLIKLPTRQELTAAVSQRYQTADRANKKLILDEFTKVTGYHRKHAIRILTSRPVPTRERPAAHRIYQQAAKEALVVLWEAADRICGKRLKALLPELIGAMERHKHLQLGPELRAQLLAMSAATIDRQLGPVRERAYAGRKKRTALNRIRKMVPVRTFADWGDVQPGYLEVDFVVHCGDRLVGSFVHTLVLTDVASGWTECIALPIREQTLVVEAINGLRDKLPFPLLGLDTDNDGAFMNDTLLAYCAEQGIFFTRSRAYRKNDQAWVEQKNGAIVRKLIGYGRLQGLTATAALRRVYESSRLYTNFFQPSFKLKSKEREGARVHKKYHLPEAPYRRLLDCDTVSHDAKKMLRRTMEPLDPVLLLKQIREAQDTVMALSQNRTPEDVAPDMQAFVSGLATAWKVGEVRPTHWQEAKPGRWWRTRKDPFGEVWPMLLGWLEETPDVEAKEMLKRLQTSGYGEFPDRQLRTLQRRIRLWRMRVVQKLVYGADQNGASSNEIPELHSAEGVAAG
jgi:hypothetical protein